MTPVPQVTIPRPEQQRRVWNPSPLAGKKRKAGKKVEKELIVGSSSEEDASIQSPMPPPILDLGLPEQMITLVAKVLSRCGMATHTNVYIVMYLVLPTRNVLR